MRPSRDLYYLGIARAVAARSTCPRAPDGVGCVIVRADEIIATGYAGSARGAPHCTEEGCLIGPTGGCTRTRHAEDNAIDQLKRRLGYSAGPLIIGATVYVTMSPCVVCADLLEQSRVRRIVYGREYRISAHLERLRARGVLVEHVPLI